MTTPKNLLAHVAKPARTRLLLVLGFCALASSALAQTQDDFFNDAVLHDVRLTVNKRDWQNLKEHDDENTYYPADLRWGDVTVRNVGIRSRGHATRNGIKPGIHVDLNRYVSHQDFLGLKTFMLKNVYDDPTLVHESVSMKMFARMGVAAPREAHTRLFVNEEYVGVYVIVEAVDRTFIKRVFGPDEGSADHGGYLYKYEKVRDYQFDYLGSDLEPYATMFTAQTRETDPAVTIYGPIEELVRVVNQTPDSQFVSAVSARIDLVQAMKYLAIEDFMAEVDGFVGSWTMNNFYLYRSSATGIALLIPWDTGQTFSSLTHPIDFDLATNVLTIRAMAVPELRQVYMDTLAQCAALAQEVDPNDPDPRGWLEREVWYETQQIAAAVAVDPVLPVSVGQFYVSSEGVRKFGQLRSTFVSCEVSKAADPSNAPQDCSVLLEPPPDEP